MASVFGNNRSIDGKGKDNNTSLAFFTIQNGLVRHIKKNPIIFSADKKVSLQALSIDLNA